MRRSSYLLVLVALWLAAMPGLADAAEPTAPVQSEVDQPATTPAEIEADWLHQDQIRRRTAAAGPDVKPEEDAPGALDGVKTGKWGFHTQNEPDPWWQVDLLEPIRLDRIVLYNRSMPKRSNKSTSTTAPCSTAKPTASPFR